MTRQQANYQLVNLLHQLIAQNPELRFGQILQGFDFVKYIEEPDYAGAGFPYWENEFYIEPQDILDRVITAARKLK